MARQTTTAATAPTSISGQYEGEMTAPSSGLSFLDLRIDVDKRYPNSPVMKRVSGDFYQLNKITVPGSPPKVTRVYRESWIVKKPTLKNVNGKVTITGKVTFWKGIHPSNTLKISMESTSAKPDQHSGGDDWHSAGRKD